MKTNIKEQREKCSCCKSQVTLTNNKLDKYTVVSVFTNSNHDNE